MTNKGLRLSETWFERGLWIIAVLFASFLIGIGALVVGDLPKVEKPVDAEAFMDQAKLRPLRAQIKADEAQQQDLEEALERANLDASHARDAYSSERESFDAWIATRTATQQSSQNPEVLTRTHRLDELKVVERAAETKAGELENRQTDLRQTSEAHHTDEAAIQQAGQAGYDRAVSRMELRVFLLRLALTLPLLLLAIWLFVKRRKSPRWPFVWGFIFFALFTFFFELVPYLPSYGGYFRYLVGIALTVWGGNYAIVALRKYLEAQKAAEQRPEQERRRDLGYEMAQARLSKRICPACERPIDTGDLSGNFCMHCGLRVFEDCTRCHTRQTSFSHFCRACGLVKQSAPPQETQLPAPLTQEPV
ncbi:MAG: serine endopeptidase [Janthinobacterium lividum]